MQTSLLIALSQQAGLLLAGAARLDGGWVWRTVLVAIVAYWVATGVIVMRHGRYSLAPRHVFFIAFGIFPLWLLIAVCLAISVHFHRP